LTTVKFDCDVSETVKSSYWYLRLRWNWCQYPVVMYAFTDDARNGKQQSSGGVWG